jgi:hypothetical protein
VGPISHSLTYFYSIETLELVFTGRDLSIPLSIT